MQHFALSADYCRASFSWCRRYFAALEQICRCLLPCSSCCCYLLLLPAAACYRCVDYCCRAMLLLLLLLPLLLLRLAELSVLSTGTVIVRLSQTLTVQDAVQFVILLREQAALLQEQCSTATLQSSIASQIGQVECPRARQPALELYFRGDAEVKVLALEKTKLAVTASCPLTKVFTHKIEITCPQCTGSCSMYCWDQFYCCSCD